MKQKIRNKYNRLITSRVMKYARKMKKRATRKVKSLYRKSKRNDGKMNYHNELEFAKKRLGNITKAIAKYHSSPQGDLEWHHQKAKTKDKIDPDEIKKCKCLPLYHREHTLITEVLNGYLREELVKNSSRPIDLKIRPKYLTFQSEGGFEP